MGIRLANALNSASPGGLDVANTSLALDLHTAAVSTTLYCPVIKYENISSCPADGRWSISSKNRIPPSALDSHPLSSLSPQRFLVNFSSPSALLP